jgi:hypothetical protein
LQQSLYPLHWPEPVNSLLPDSARACPSYRSLRNGIHWDKKEN